MIFETYALCYVIYIFQILGSLHDRFYKVVCQENFSKLYCTGGVKTQVIDLLESVRGVALGTRVDNLNRIFDFLHPLLQECVKILGKIIVFLKKFCKW